MSYVHFPAVFDVKPCFHAAHGPHVMPLRREEDMEAKEAELRALTGSILLRSSAARTPALAGTAPAEKSTSPTADSRVSFGFPARRQTQGAPRSGLGPDGEAIPQHSPADGDDAGSVHGSSRGRLSPSATYHTPTAVPVRTSSPEPCVRSGVHALLDARSCTLVIHVTMPPKAMHAHR